MTDSTISGLPAATTLTGSEPVPIVQGGATVKTTAAAIAGSGGLFRQIDSTATPGGLVGINWEGKNSSTSATGEGGLWPGSTYAFAALTASFTSVNAPTSAPAAAASLFLVSRADGASGDTTPLLTDAVVNTNGGIAFGGNLIARSGAGVTSPTLVGLEIDVAPLAGQTVNSASIGLAINAFNATVPIALQIGPGLGDAPRFTNGIQASNVTGTVLSVGSGGAVAPDSLTNSYLAPALGAYGTDAHILQAGHKTRFYLSTGDYWRLGTGASGSSLTLTCTLGTARFEAPLMAVTATTASSSTTTGALTVAGGLGVAGTIYGNGSGITNLASSALPAATTGALGGVIIGSGLSITTGGTLSVSGGGTVTSVDATGGTTGLTFTGTPITSSGTLTLGGTLAIGSGGTGQTTASAAANALLGGLSTTQGALTYRGASAWTALAPGTAGQVLTSGGSGANPVYADMAFGAAISGRYYSNHAASVNAGNTFATGTLYYVPFAVWRGFTISDIGIALASSTNLVAGSKARLGIYGSATTGPGSLLLDAGETANLSFGTAPSWNGIAISGNYTFPRPGLYWLGVTFNQSAYSVGGGIYGLINTAGTNMSSNMIGSSLNSVFATSSSFVHGCTESFTYGALPATASATPTFGAVTYPQVAVRAA